MMRVWIISFILLFGSAELLQWLQKFSLPLPIFILGGAFLAVASNYNKLTNLPFHPDYEEPQAIEEETLSAKPVQSKPVTPAQQSTSPSISFTVQKPFQPRD